MSEQDKERIEKESDTIAKRVYIHKTSAQIGYCKGYIAGATAEHERMAELLKQERNKTIDDVIEKLYIDVKHGVLDRFWLSIKQDLEALKLKSE